MRATDFIVGLLRTIDACCLQSMLATDGAVGLLLRLGVAGCPTQILLLSSCANLVRADDWKLGL